MMRVRSDLSFVFFTKRIGRLAESLPPDWGDGYPNVTVGCTCENQARADERLPVFLSLPVARRMVVCEPLLERIDLRRYLAQGGISAVTVGGESGENARECCFEWVLDLHRACAEYGVPFHYHQTGALLRRDGKLYRIPRARQHEQARLAGLELH